MSRRHRHPTHHAAHPEPMAAEASRNPRLGRLRSGVEVIRGHRRRNPRLYRNSGRGLLVMLGLLAVVSVAVYVIGRIDVLRLSGTADVQISSAVLFAGSGFDQSPAGTTIRYTYSVDGTTYAGVDFRRWLDVAAHRPKVCFDPSNPANHTLVDGSYRCGSGPSP